MESTYNKILSWDDKWRFALQINFYPKRMKNQNQSWKAWSKSSESKNSMLAYKPHILAKKKVQI